MGPNQARVCMNYLKFWDNFNWKLYIRILEIKLENTK